MTISIVIGALYGDEGKGKWVSALAENSNQPVTVVRSNGGAQAGHTVSVNGQRHVFHHFGSATLQGGNTYLSRYIICNPILYNQEFDQLIKIARPHADVHPSAPITTPFEMLINQALEIKRGGSRHGSCGLGIGETIEREEQGYRLVMSDLPALSMYRLVQYRNTWVKERLEKHGLDRNDEMVDFIYRDEILHRYLDDVEKMLMRTRISENLPKDHHLIFEGAQGLLLDEELGHFPYVTRSRTGLANPLQIIMDNMMFSADTVTCYYVARCYQTRHGAGPMALETDISPYFDIEDKTNVPNPWQGTIRYGLFDNEEYESAIERDLKRSEKLIDRMPFLYRQVFTCMDQIRDPASIPVRIEGKVEMVERKWFEERGFDFSYSPDETMR